MFSNASLYARCRSESESQHSLLPIESVFDRGGVWYHAKGLDALSLEDTQLEDRCKTIPRAEAEQLMERYTKQYEALPFTPFAA